MRIGIDKANNLTECPVEFEVLQEFVRGGSSGREEKITLGKVTLNLSEYVEESEAMLRDTGRSSFASERDKTSSSTAAAAGHARKRSSLSGSSMAPPSSEGISPTSKAPSIADQASTHQEVEEGVIRRYLMQESKINSTLKVGILMVQVDGERNFAAPPLKTAPVFGGIAGMVMTGTEGTMDPGAAAHAPENSVDAATAPVPALTKSRDASELQDMYRRALAASWACQPGELPADECIEDIFAGGDGFKADAGLVVGAPRKSGSRVGLRRENSGSTSTDDYDIGATLRPVDARRFRGHARTHSGESERSTHTVTGRHEHGGRGEEGHRGHRRDGSKDHHRHSPEATRSRRDSLASLATTVAGERGRSGFKSAREVGEFEVREDLVAWKLPESVA